jgi:hypothetical protein
MARREPGSLKVADVHRWSLEKSSALSNYFIANYVKPLEIIAALNRAGVRFLLIGSHGLGGWLQEPRASQDVDILAMARDLRKSVRILLAEFARLEAEDGDGMTRLRYRETGKAAIDVMKPNREFFRAAFRHTHTVRFGGQSYRIPSLEMALVLKFAPMVSRPWSDAQKYLDAHDFMCIALANPGINTDKLAELGELVYPGGGAEIVEKVRQVRAGEKMNL